MNAILHEALSRNNVVVIHDRLFGGLHDGENSNHCILRYIYLIFCLLDIKL